jgi:hypothetical protein
MRLNFGVRRRRTRPLGGARLRARSREGDAEWLLVECGGSAAEAPALVKECCLKHLLGGKLEDTRSPHSGPPRNTCAPPPQPVGAPPSVAPFRFGSRAPSDRLTWRCSRHAAPA